jgi:UDP-N-acetyl-D-mannosaminuronic acid transferase (WecB/TagA/CpsF family)
MKFKLKELIICGSRADLASVANGKKIINTINAHSYNTALKDELFAEALVNGDVLIPDGASIVMAPVQEKFKCYMADKAQLEAQMKKGAEEASYVARRTLSKVQKKLGFVQIR